MTALRQSAIMELEKIPEDKLSFVIQIMQGVNGLYNDSNKERKDAFARLEQLRKKGTVTDDDAELASYMEDKYGKYLDIFTDVHGNINLELLANAVKAEMKEKSADGFVVNILNKPVRFGEDDVNQLVEIFKTFKQNN